MKHLHILINTPSISHWILINQIIIKGSSSLIYYYPDILTRHPFKEGSLLLSEESALSKTIASVFKKYPPHKISLFKVNDSQEQRALFKDFQASIGGLQKPSFFSTDELASIALLHKALRLTESQKIQLKKACISTKLRYPDTDMLLVLMKPYTALMVKNKAERKCVFDELNDKLWH
ncbi:MAG: hypothetical protein RR614_04940 [Eubacterium sp.]